MNVYILSDLEGVAGVASFVDDTYSDGRFYNRSRRLLTKEVNAAVQGAVESGASRIAVLDGHGAGGIDPEDLHREALLLMGREFPYGFGIDDSYDAMLFVGQHSMAQLKGNLAHTFSSRAIAGVWLNGKPIGEFGVWAIYAGTFGVPVVFLSGDDVACGEARELVPDIVTVATKTTLSVNAAMTLSPEKSRERIREGVCEALGRASEIRPVREPGPYTLRIQYLRSDLADAAERNGYTRVDLTTVEAQSDDYRSLCPPGRPRR